MVKMFQAAREELKDKHESDSKVNPLLIAHSDGTFNVDDNKSCSIDSIGKRFGIGKEKHNAIDTSQLLAELMIVFRILRKSKNGMLTN